jgi:hypothetical protein
VEGASLPHSPQGWRRVLEHLGRHPADVDGLDLEERSKVGHAANLSVANVGAPWLL